MYALNTELPPIWHSEEHLLQQLKQGRKAAFEHFYKTHRIQLYCFAYYLVKKEQEAKEIMLDAFHKLKLYRSLLKNIKEVEPLLLKAVYDAGNRFVARYELTCHPMDSEAMLEKIATATAMQHITLLKEQLPEPLKTIYQLAHSKEPLGDGEIAQYLHLPVKTVRKKRRFAENIIRYYGNNAFNERLGKKNAR